MPQQNVPGTRFRLFPQFDEGFEPETVEVVTPDGGIAPGPSDARMRAVNAVRKLSPYEPPVWKPPYPGAVHPPALPDRAGHFDTIPESLPQFRAAHLYGTVRFVLDIWERRLGSVRWWHPDAPAVLELIPVVAWRNAQSGPGFIEMGLWPGPSGTGTQPFCLNFDVVAHEVGHAILFGTMGVPPDGSIGAEFLAFHESFSDLVALLGALFFPSVRTRLLGETGGNLYALNVVSRLGETSSHQQVRIAANDARMRDLVGLRLAPGGQWLDPSGMGRDAHALSNPFTGAVFDLLVELFQNGLAERGVIRPRFDARDWSERQVAMSMRPVQVEHATAMARFHEGFEASLLEARDVLMEALAYAIRTVAPADATYDHLANALLEGILAQGYGRLSESLLSCFTWRDIAPAAAARRSPPGVARGQAWSAAMGGSCPCNTHRALMPHSYRAA